MGALTYWRAGATVSKLCKEMFALRRKVTNHHCSIAERYGFDPDRYYSRRGMFSGGVEFIAFKALEGRNIDMKLFKRLKNSPDGYAPRHSTKAGKALWREIESLKDEGLEDIMRAIGMKPIGPGLSCRNPGVELVKGVYYVTVPADITPKGCRRISDLAYEKAANPAKRKKV